MRRTSVRTLVALVVAVVAGFFGPSLLAEDWRGQGRVHGVVLDADGEPLDGARIELRPTAAEVATGGPPAVVSTADGRWAVPLLAPGLYEIRIEGPGHLPAEGWVRVPAEGAGETVRVEMQSLDLVTPLFAEGDPAGSVRRWLDVGDALLAQGRTTEAREEYRKALGTPGVLGPPARAELLSEISRSHFLEGDLAAAEEALRAALVVAPEGSPEADRMRQLHAVVLENADRGAEADRFLARLREDRTAVEAEVADLLAPQRRPPADPAARPPDRPIVAAGPARVGRFRTTLPQGDAGSPLARREVYERRFAGGRSGAAADELRDLGERPAETTFEVYVPAGEPAEAGDGLFVWVSPTPFGGVENPEIQAALDRSRLIWVGANGAGNDRPTWERVGLALDAAHGLASLYDIAPERVYVGGYSGGGRVASGLALLYPEVFRGALTVYGVSWFEPVPVGDKPGAHWPASFASPPDASLRRLREESRLVLVTGSRDFNKPQTRAVHRAIEAAGFADVTYLEVPGASHYELPPGEWWERALQALD